MILYIGNAAFEDVYLPAKGKSEWGMDTLLRKVRGAREDAPEFIATLAQGQTYEEDYFLQTWEADDDPIWATLSLFYKGLVTGGTPTPDIQTEIVPASGSISKSYPDENNGSGRYYKTITLWRFQFLAPDLETVTTDDPVGTRQVYTTGVTMEFTYDAVQTVYRYVTTGKPSRPRYFQVDIPRVPTIKRSRITTADGSVYGNNAPVAFADLVPTVQNKVVGFTAHHVIGSPYYECQDVVRRELGENESDTEGTFGG